MRRARPGLTLGHLPGRQQQRSHGARGAVRRLRRARLDLALPPAPGQPMSELCLGRRIGGRQYLDRAGGEGRALDGVQFSVSI
jgi:hypothetical protein